jgi:tripartite-type tricarboxylate transporter receptor subunit TctC
VQDAKTTKEINVSQSRTSLRWLAAPLLALVAAFASLVAPAYAQGNAAADFPTRPIRMIVPFPPGGGFDAIARPFAERLSTVIGKQVIVDNRAGAGGNIGTEMAARAPADGYTILFANEVLSTNPNIYKSVPFDPIRDFAPIIEIGITPLAIAVFPGLPVKNLKELIALSKKQPLTFGTPGIGTSPHLYGELLNMSTPLKLRHVPYKGTGPAITDAMGGQIDMVLTTISSLAPQIRADKLRGISILSGTRSPSMPELPTLAEGGLKVPPHDVWYGLVAPAGTAPVIIKRINDAAAEVLQQRELIERLQKAGYEPKPGSSEDLAELIRTDLIKWQRVVIEANIPKE